jgi:hypothetical protein
MKPITERLLSTGLINSNFVRMLEKWGTLDPKEVAMVKSYRTQLGLFMEELDTLLDEHKPIKETRFEINIKEPPTNLWTDNNGIFSAVKDEFERYIVGPKVKLSPGDYVWKPLDDGKSPSVRVLEVLPLYEGDTVVAQQVTVSSSE